MTYFDVPSPTRPSQIQVSELFCSYLLTEQIWPNLAFFVFLLVHATGFGSLLYYKRMRFGVSADKGFILGLVTYSVVSDNRFYRLE